MFASLPRTLTVASLLLAGCGAELPAPNLESVSPNRGWNGEETAITIQGADFLPAVELNTGSRRADLNRGFEAWLESEGAVRQPLAGVSADDYETLRAVVRQGLSEGVYALVVAGPSGREDRLENAFTVSSTRADRLSLSVDSLVATVNDLVFADVVLLDPAGEPVLAEQQVEIRVSSADGPVSVSFGSGLTDQQLLEPGVIIGGLGPDGVASIPYSVAVPGPVEITVAPVDPASAVAEDSVSQLWQAGEDLSVTFELPEDPLLVDAGATFPVVVRVLDQFGNQVTGLAENVLVQTNCLDLTRAWTLTGNDVFDVQVRASTDLGNCEDQFIEVVSGPEGRSASFEVRAGAADAVVVQPLFASVRAGDDVLAEVSTRDEFGNRVAAPGQILLTDDVGGLGPGSCSLSLNGVDSTCRAPSFVAAAAVRLTAQITGITGTSAPYTVLPRLDVESIETLGPQTVRAGDTFQLTVRLVDPFGNRIPPADVDLGALQVESGGRTDVCQLVDPLPVDEVALDCVLEVAGATDVEVAYAGAPEAAVAVEVTNGPLDTVTLDAPDEVVAGQEFAVFASGVDAFGNPYLNDTGQGAAVQPGTSGAQGLVFIDGLATVDLTLFTAGTVGLTPLVDGVRAGDLADVSVVAGPANALELEPSAPWAFTSAPLVVAVEAVDAFGNRAVLDAPLVLSSDGGAGADQFALLLGGLSLVDYVWDTPVAFDQITATAGALTGTATIAAVAQQCADGPSAVVSFAGEVEGRACLEPTQASASVATSLASSTAGTAPLARFLIETGGAATDSADAELLVDVTEIGRTVVRGLVLDTDLCGDEAASVIWAGPDDGRAVGTFDVDVPAAIELGDLVSVTASDVRDCTGDPASGSNLLFRTDRGVAVDAVPTGAGLAIPIDASGAGQVMVDFGSSVEGGAIRMVFESPSGGGRTVGVGELSGDNRSPRVDAQTPSGDTEGMVDTVVFRFDEPLLPATITPAAFEIVDFEGLPLGVSVALDEPARVTLTLDVPIPDASIGVWSVGATTALRDLAGNRLDGQRIGGPSAWTGDFGALENSLAPVSCTASTSLFRPDGDPGTGEPTEMDLVSGTMTADAIPNQWSIRIEDDEGSRVNTQVFAASDPDGAWEWDGRDASGRVVPNGSYTIRIAGADGFGNRSAPCVLSVIVDNGVR